MFCVLMMIEAVKEYHFQLVKYKITGKISETILVHLTFTNTSVLFCVQLCFVSFGCVSTSAFYFLHKEQFKASSLILCLLMLGYHMHV